MTGALLRTAKLNGNIEKKVRDQRSKQKANQAEKPILESEGERDHVSPTQGHARKGMG